MRQLKITHTLTVRDSLSITKYLQEINKVDLISPEEEAGLAKRIRKGDEQALQTLVSANLRFVVSVAKQYPNPFLSLNDLINEGNIGLMKAANRFDPTRGFKFISYAVWWIRQSIMMAMVEQTRLVRLPLNKTSVLRKLNSAFSELEQQYEREPTTEELAEILNLDSEEVNNTLIAGQKTHSIDAPFFEGEEGTLADVLEDPDSRMADADMAYSGSLKTDLERLLDILPEHQRMIIKWYFGLEGSDALGLHAIAEKMSISSVRAGQLRDRALVKLRMCSNVTMMQEYLCQ